MNLEKELKLIAEDVNKECKRISINKPILLIGTENDLYQREKLKNYLLKESPYYQIYLTNKKDNYENEYYTIDLDSMRKLKIFN